MYRHQKQFVLRHIGRFGITGIILLAAGCPQPPAPLPLSADEQARERRIAEQEANREKERSDSIRNLGLRKSEFPQVSQWISDLARDDAVASNAVTELQRYVDAAGDLWRKNEETHGLFHLSSTRISVLRMASIENLETLQAVSKSDNIDQKTMAITLLQLIDYGQETLSPEQLLTIFVHLAFESETLKEVPRWARRRGALINIAHEFSRRGETARPFVPVLKAAREKLGKESMGFSVVDRIGAPVRYGYCYAYRQDSVREDSPIYDATMRFGEMFYLVDPFPYRHDKILAGEIEASISTLGQPSWRELVPLLAFEDPVVLGIARNAIQRSVGESDDQWKEFSSLLDVEDWEIQVAAIKAIQRSVPNEEATAAAERLTELKDSHHSEVAYQATITSAELRGTEITELEAVFLTAFEDKSSSPAFWQAARKYAGPKLTAQFKEIILTETDPVIRRKAVEKLGRMGTAAKATLPLLTALLNDNDVELRKAADAAIDQIRDK